MRLPFTALALFTMITALSISILSIAMLIIMGLFGGED